MFRSLFCSIRSARNCAAGFFTLAAACLAPVQAQDEVVFLDPGVSGAELFEQASGDAEYVRLDAARAPLEQIAEHMDGRNGVRSVHLISHGAPGALQFAGGRIDGAALDSGSVYLSRIRAALADGADVRLYACRVAEGEEGRAFAGSLADALDSDLAASSDITGAAGMGGDWDLEWRRGDMEDSAIHRRFAVSGYRATLADLGSDVTVTFEDRTFNDGGAGITNPLVDASGFSFASSSGFLGGDGNAGESGTNAIYPYGSARELEITYSGDNFAFNSFYINTTGRVLDFEVRGYDSGGAPVATQNFSGVGAPGTLTLTEAGFSEVASVVIEGTTELVFLQGVAFDSFSFSAPSSPDTTAPRVTSVVRRDPPSSSTHLDSLVFRVTFDEDVQNVDVTDFEDSVTSTQASAVDPVSASQYDVTLSAAGLADHEGAVSLVFDGVQDIADLAGNNLSNTTPTGANESYTLDNTAPALTAFERNSPSGQNTNADILVFDITFDGAVQNVTADDFTITGTTATGVIGGSGAAYTLTVSGGNLAGLTGTVGLDLAGGHDITDAAGNLVPAGEPATDETYVLDNTAPVLSAFARATPTGQNTNADILVFDITFDDAVQNVTADDFTITGTTATGVIGGSGAAYTLTVSGGNLAGLTGTVGLDLVGTHNIGDASGNLVAAAEPAIDETYSVDNTAPRVTSVVRRIPPSADTNLDSLIFRVTFDEAVANVGAGDFAVSASTATATDVTPNSATEYDVTISGGNLESFEGTVSLVFDGAQDIADLAGNDLVNTTPTGANESYTLDNTAPALTAFTRNSPSGQNTNADSLVFDITFDGAVQNVTADDFTVTGTTATGVIGGSGAAYTLTVSGGNLAGLTGTVGLDLDGGHDITDAAGNLVPAGEPATDETYSVENTEPRVTSIVRQMPSVAVTRSDSLVFRVTFDQAVQGVDTSDFVATASSAAATDVTPNSASEYDVTLSGGNLASFDGTVGLGFAGAQDIEDLLTNPLTNTTPTGANESYTVDNTAPAGFSVSFDQDPVTGASENAVSFTFAGGEASADYGYTISSSGGGTNVTGSGTLGGATDQIGPIDVSGLNDGTLTLSVTLTDPAGNVSGAQTDAATKDTNLPAFSKAFAPASIQTGDVSTLTFTIDNSALAVPATALDFTDNLPAGMEVAATPNASTTCTGGTLTAVAAAGVVSYTGGTIAAGASCTVDVDVTATAAGALVNTTGDLTSSLGNSGTAGATLTVTQPGLSVDDPSVAEGDAGTANLVFTVTLAPASAQTVTVDYATSNGTATAGADYTAATGTLTFTPGQTSRTVTVTVLNETVVEPDETVILTLSNPSNATIGDATGTGTIQTDDTDAAAPVVASIERQTPANATTNADTLTWTVTFSENVTGVDAADFAVNGSTASVTGVTGSGAVYSVTVSGGDLAGLSGTVGLGLVAGVSIDDLAGNALTGLNPAGADETYLLDSDGPSVTLDAGITGSATAPFTLTVTFSEPVSGFSLCGLTVSNATAGDFQSVSASVYTVSITPPDSGSFSLSVPGGVATDSAGNANTASDVLTLETDGLAPEVVSVEALNALVTNTDTPAWRVTFSESVDRVDASDFILTGASGAAFSVSSGDDTVFEITASGGSLADLDGEIVLGFAAGQDIADSAGNALADTAPAGTDQSSVTLDNTAPDVTLTGSEDEVTGPFMVTIGFSEAVTGFALDDLVLDNATAETLTQVSALEYTVEITPETFGEISVSIGADAAADAAGNGSLAASLTTEAVTPQVDVEIDIDVDDNDPVGVAGTATVSNPGELPVDFRAEANVAWLSVTPQTGTIEGLSEIVFTVSVTEEARNLAPGDYTGQVTIYRIVTASSTVSRAAPTATGEAVLVEIPVSLSLASTKGTLQLVSTTPGGPSGDASFAFASDLPAIDGQVLATSGGRAQTSVMELTGGTFDVLQSVPQGWRIDAISCSGDTDQGSQIDTASGRIQVDLDIGEAIVCTFENARDEDAVRLATQRAIRNFMLRRADRIIEAAPDLSRRLGARDIVRPGEFAANVDGGRYNLSMSASLSGMRNSAKADEPDAPGVRVWEREPDDRLDVWMSAEMSGVSDDRAGERAESDFGVFQLGADWAISDDMLIGAMLQYDWMDEEAREVFVEAGAVAGAVVSGEGWMAGPYLVWRFADGITFDGMALYGTSANTVNPLGLYEDDFDTDRWMLRANLTGEYSDGGPWTLRPQATLTHFEESQDAYTDSLGIAIPGQSITLGRFAAGPEVIWRHPRANGGHFELSTRMRAVWDYHPAELLGEAGLLTGGESDLRADGRFGAGAVFANGAMLGLEVSLAGIGDGDFEANSARINFRVPLSLGR